MVTEEQANRIWDILVEECGARAEADQFACPGREHFTRYLVEPSRSPFEYRFCGSLGWGGKFHARADGSQWRVSCYSEHETPARREAITRANDRLGHLETGRSE